MKVSREGTHICRIFPHDGICEPNTNTATADVDPERRASFKAKSEFYYFIFDTDVFCGCDRNRGGSVTEAVWGDLGESEIHGGKAGVSPSPPMETD